MAWKEEYRCKHCGSPIGRGIRVRFNGDVVPNMKKKCSECKQYGCLRCMSGSLYSGVFRHISCKVGKLNGVEIVFPRFLS